MKKALFSVFLAAFFTGTSAFIHAGATVRFHVTNAAGDDPLPCRIYLVDSANQKALHPAEAPFWEKGFVCDGSAVIAVSAGAYRYTIEKGPEWKAVSGKLRVADESEVPVTASLARLADLKAEGWFSGDLHVHRKPSELPLHLRAEDLSIASVQTWWNKRNPWNIRTLPEPVKTVDRSRFYHILSGEDERGGGALLFHRMTKPIAITDAEREWPSSVKFLQEARAQGAWIEIEKPFWWDTPAWLAAGRIDSIGIAQNHLQRRGMLDNEAWGRPRDREKYPGPHGNGFYTQDLYYKILNSGFRIPPSAGSASGVLANPVGYNRVYVHTESPLTWDAWWEGLGAGHSFVTNGPLLRVTANGSLPGTVLRTATDTPLTVRLAGKLDAHDPIHAVQLVQNGSITEITLPAQVTIAGSGWFLVRAITGVEDTFRFASTAPWYVEIGGKKLTPQRNATAFFLEWARQRQANVGKAIADEERRREAVAPQTQAVSFWEERWQSSSP